MSGVLFFHSAPCQPRKLGRLYSNTVYFLSLFCHVTEQMFLILPHSRQNILPDFFDSATISLKHLIFHFSHFLVRFGHGKRDPLCGYYDKQQMLSSKMDAHLNRFDMASSQHQYHLLSILKMGIPRTCQHRFCLLVLLWHQENARRKYPSSFVLELKKVLEQLSRTRSFTGFEMSAFFYAQLGRKGREFQIT